MPRLRYAQAMTAGVEAWLASADLKTEGILVLPHIGGGHPGRTAAVAELFTGNARRFLAGERLDAAVDKASGY